MKTATLLCQCNNNILDKTSMDDLQSDLETLPTQVIVVDDLCACSINDKKTLNKELSGYNELRIIACYDRVVCSLFHQTGVKISPKEVYSLKEQSTENIKKEIGSKLQDNKANTLKTVTLKTSLKVPAWFPIVEQSECSKCSQCADFCLFGVYKLKNKTLKVHAPLSCKNNCPACGRTCPSKAIMFPKLKEDSTLAGKAISKEDAPIVMDGSMLSALNQRNAQRKSILQAGVMEQANKERDAALKAMKFIPTKKENK